jgi:hypothetical protein
VHEYPDPLVGQSEQIVGLDDLQSLVHQGGGIDRDLGPHLPRGVGERLLRGDPGEVRPPAERTARGGEHYAGDIVARYPGQALGDGGVLGVDRLDAASATPCRVETQLAAGDEALLVRQGEGLAGLERDQGGLQAGRADDCVQHDI